MNGDRNKINEYGILWRKSSQNSVNKTNWYYHIHTSADHYTVNNMDSDAQYEVLVAAVSSSLVPEPFTLIVIPKSPDSIFNGWCTYIFTDVTLGVYVNLLAPPIS